MSRRMGTELCLCNCGLTVTKGSKYRQGHCFRGRPKSEEWRRKFAAVVRTQQWKDRISYGQGEYWRLKRRAKFLGAE